MAAPNIVNVTSIFGFTTTIALTTTAGAVLLANASSSGKVFKINTIIASNVDGTNDGAVTIAFNTDAGGTGTSTELASTITVPAQPISKSSTSSYLKCTIPTSTPSSGSWELLLLSFSATSDPPTVAPRPESELHLSVF